MSHERQMNYREIQSHRNRSHVTEGGISSKVFEHTPSVRSKHK